MDGALIEVPEPGRDFGLLGAAGRGSVGSVCSKDVVLIDQEIGFPLLNETVTDQSGHVVTTSSGA
jgi:hypothetical protein